VDTLRECRVMYQDYCDHTYVRDDEYTKQCIKCKQYKGVKND